MQQERLLLGVKQLVGVAPPQGPVSRVARGLDPFEPPDWRYTGGNRFDDPRTSEEALPGERFRVLYAATRAAGAYGETIARYRTDFKLLAGLKAIDDDEPFDPRLRPGMVPADYRQRCRLGTTELDPDLRFVDLYDPETVQALRPTLATLASNHGFNDVDFSVINGLHRDLTRKIALHIYEQYDSDGKPLFAGIRYPSRLNPEWELWAIFFDRLKHTPLFPKTIFPDDPELLEAASVLGVVVETFDGRYI